MDFAALTAAVAESAPVVAEVVPTVPGRTLHIDGDGLAYFAGGNEDMTTSTSRSILLGKVGNMKDACGAEKVVLHLTASGSTKGDRYAVAVTKPYQGNRTNSQRPKNWAYLRNFMLESGHPDFTVKNWHDREADDGFGYIATARPNDVVGTDDKDMRMLPGLHIQWRGHALVNVPQGCFELVVDDKTYGHKFFWWQMLRGDTADNIPGLPSHPNHKRGVGEAAATALLGEASNNQEAYEAVRAAYKAYAPGNWDRLLCEQASLLWMRRDRLAHLNDWLAYLGKEIAFEDFIHEAAKEQYDRVEALKKEAHAISQAASQ